MERKGNQAIIKRVDSTGRRLKQSERQGTDGRYYFDVTIKGERFRTSADNLDSLREKEDHLYTLFTLRARDDQDLITVNDAFELWAETKRGIRENTLSNYRYLYRQYVQHSNIGRAELIDVKKSDVKKFYNRLAEKKGLSTSTIDGVHTVLRQVFQVAVDDGYLLVNPAEKALFELRRAHEHDREERHALTTDEESRLLSFLETSREYGHWKNILVVLLETGMRIGELTSLAWQDIDFEHEMIHVQRTLAYYCRNGETGYYMHPPKTRNSNRLIPMMGKTKEALLAEKQRQAEADNECCMVINGISDFVFLNRFGKVYHEGTVNRAIHRIVKASNAEIDAGKVDEKYRIRDFTAHCTRHTFATKAVESGMSIKAYQQILGHTDFQTSMDIYCHITEQMLMDAKSDYELFLEWREQHFKKKNENMEVKKDGNE